MRIAFFTDSFLPYLSGVSVSLGNFSKALVKRRHELLVFAPHPGKENDSKRDKRIKVEWLPSLKTFYPDFRIGAPTPKSFIKLKRFNPDVIHVHTPLLIGAQGVLGAKLLNKPFVFSFHTYYMDPESFKVFGIKKRIKRLEKTLWDFTKKFTKNAEVIIAPTDFVANDLKKRKFLNKIEILPTGIEIERFIRDERRKEELKKELDLHGKIILAVGRLSHEKGWDFLLESFKFLYERGKRYTLVFIGGGPAEEHLRLLARLYRVEHRVRFLGEIAYDELIDRSYYTIGDVFAMPSDFETQGLVTLEAMGFGLPIVALKSKGTVDLVDDYGILVRKGEKEFARTLERVLTSSELRRELSKKSLKRARDFSLDKLTNRLEKVYKSVL